ncbi:MAG: MbcA/ParS/Xre antitoxin family protein [Halobacteriales archaeon]|nr:MbcA/ParS/Xre antitoxin family protein [Halobacteriales archaeon]
MGGVPPIEAASTELGALEVLDLVGRIRHGVY